MPPSRFPPGASLFLVGVAALWLPHGLHGADRAAPVSGTLPESNEALLLIGRTEEALRRGDHRLALELIERTRSLPPGLVAAPASRTYYPLWRRATALLASLPPPALEVYRQLHDAEVAARFERAAARADVPELRELFRLYRAASDWVVVGQELAALLMDTGQFGEAVRVLRELVQSEAGGPGAAAAHRRLLAVALARVGAVASAVRLLDANAAEADAVADADAQLRAWLSEQSHKSLDGADGTGEFRPMLAPRLNWTTAIDGDGSDPPRDREADLSAAIEATRRQPTHRPIVEGDFLLVRMLGVLRAFDVWTLAPLWTASEGGAAAPAGGEEDVDAEQLAELPTGVEPLLRRPLSQAVSSGYGLVYTVEGGEPPGAAPMFFGRRPTRGIGETPWPNDLVARDLSTGAVAWRIVTSDFAAPLFGAVFQDAPLVLDGRLLVPVQRGDELRVAVLDPATGELRREVPIVGPPTRFAPQTGGRCGLAADESSVYVATGNGVIACLSRDELEWNWAAVYPSTLGAYLRRMSWQPEAPPADGGFDPLVLADDLLVAAPLDSPDIVALDRFSGRERWRVPRGERTVVVGAVDDGLVLGGDALECVALEDGRTLRWRSVPLDIRGRALICRGRIYVPTRAGIVELDARGGRVTTDPSLRPPSDRDAEAPRARDQAFNLVATEDALLAVSPTRVTRHADPRRLRVIAARRLAASPGGSRAAIAMAWCDALEGRLEAALERVRSRAVDDALQRAACDQLAAQVCLELARHADSPGERLQWLNLAAAAARDPEQALRLAVVVGAALEASGRTEEAIEHYLAMLLAPMSGTAPTDSEDGLRVAGWLTAQRRLRGLLADFGPGQARALLDDLVQRAAQSTESGALLTRLYGLSDDPAVRSRIDLAAAASRLPPEIMIGHLAPDDPELPEPQQRALRLRRWDTHVALGMLDDARADQQAWQARHEAPAAADASHDRETADMIRVAMNKLERSAAPLLTAAVCRQWEETQARLVFDPCADATIARAALPLRRSDSATTVLYHVMRGSELRRYEPLLPPPSRTAAIPGAGRPPLPIVPRGFLPDDGAGAGDPAASGGVDPALFYGRLALIPQPGGVLCIGMGPERYGGRQLWTRSVPEWITMPRAFRDVADADDDRVFFSPSGDRVVCLSWVDGSVRWEREVRGGGVRRLRRAGDRVVVCGERGVFSVDARFGDDLRELEAPDGRAWRDATVAGGVLVAWDGERVAGFDPRTLEPLWSRPGAASDRFAVETSRGWIAFADALGDGWLVLDARSGETLAQRLLPEFMFLTAWHAADGVCYLAGLRDTDDASVSAQGLAAYDVRRRTLLWATTLDSPIPINTTQLAASEGLIPVLMAAPRRGSAAALEVWLIDKRDGSTAGRAAIDAPLRGDPATARLIATPHRILVQAQGNVVALGSPTTPTPEADR